MGSGSRGCPQLGEEGQGAIHQGLGPPLFYSDPPSEVLDVALPSSWKGLPKTRGPLLGEGHLHVEIPAPTKQITLRPERECMHHVTWFAEPQNNTIHHSPRHCSLSARRWGTISNA